MATFINSTAGAIPVRNEKGELVMQKVKVQRYVTNKRPAYAPQADSDEEDFVLPDTGRRSRFDGAAVKRAPIEDERGSYDDTYHRSAETNAETESENEDDLDPRLRRIRETKRATNDDNTEAVSKRKRHDRHIDDADEKDRVDEERAQEVDDDAEGRHERARKIRDVETRATEHADIDTRRGANTNANVHSDASSDDDSAQAGEDEADSESDVEEEEDGRPRLFKPVFIRRKDRVTIRERERDEEKRRRELENEEQKHSEERRKETLRLIEESNRAEIDERRAAASAVHLVTASGALVPAAAQLGASVKEDEEVRDRLAALNTDSEDDQDETVAEQAYEEWKLRELRRVKRDRDEREHWQREKEEIERWHRMTEEQRKEELLRNPKVVTNAQPKGKYKFLQKYFHRGTFFLDEENDLFKRDFTATTLDDHVDRSKLPSVMQVKNFGRAGRTKWTHLVSEDTTGDMRNQLGNTGIAQKFRSSHAAGVKNVFDRPAAKKHK